MRIGHAVALFCNILGASPEPNIRWLMNGAPVTESPSGSGAKYRFLDGAQYLVIYTLTMNDVMVGGSPVNYQCQVTNVNGSETLNSFTFYNLVAVGKGVWSLYLLQPLLLFPPFFARFIFRWIPSILYPSQPNAIA